MAKYHSSGLSVVTLLCSLGCSDSSSDAVNVDVSGKWCGADVGTATACEGDEVGYLDLAQTGTLVSGKACEAFEMDCNDVQDGSVKNDKLTFFYTFADYRVDVSLTFGNSKLIGDYYSDKCLCTIPFTFYAVN